jgi:hypothetical protein
MTRKELQEEFNEEIPIRRPYYETYITWLENKIIKYTNRFRLIKKQGKNDK